MTAVLVALAGLVGVLARHALSSLVGPTALAPWVTLAINVAGSFLLGVVAVLPWSAQARTALGVGFLGGLTTFSTLALQAFLEIEAGRAGRALALVVASVVLGVGAAGLGWALGRTLV